MRYLLLEPLRGLAALWVFAYHFRFSDRALVGWPHLQSFFEAGHLGVPMFFVISGFCVVASARSAIQRGEPTLRFLFRRARRVYPPLWASMFVVAAIPFVMAWLSSLNSGEYEAPSSSNPNYGYLEFGMSDWLWYGSLAQVFRPIEAAPSLQHKFTPLNAVYWTLAIEVQFYIVVAIALMFRRRFYAVLLLVTTAALLYVFSVTDKASGLFLPYWPMFAVGAALYWLLARGVDSPCRVDSHLSRASAIFGAAFATALLVAGVACITCGFSMSWLAFAIGFGLLLFLAHPLDAKFAMYSQAKSNDVWRILVGVLMALGAMSYSLYLLHGRMQFLSMQLVRQILPTNNLGFAASAIVLTCLASYAFYLLCEKPFMSSRPRKNSTETAAAISQPAT